MPLFDVTLIELPSAKEQEIGKVPKIVFGPKTVFAKDSTAAIVVATMGENIQVVPEKLDVKVRAWA